MNLEEAYEEMRRREWGFARQFGMVAVGPFRHGVVEVLGMDTDPVRAVEKAIETETRRTQTPNP